MPRDIPPRPRILELTFAALVVVILNIVKELEVLEIAEFLPVQQEEVGELPGIVDDFRSSDVRPTAEGGAVTALQMPQVC